IKFADAEHSFSGTSGIIRRTQSGIELALFHGTRIGSAGFTLSTTDTDLGISASVTAGHSPRGEYYAPKASSATIEAASLPAKAIFYIDGQAQFTKRQGNALILNLKPGHHHWELTDTLPVPVTPEILRTENHSGGGRIVLRPVASATRYRLELSRDNGSTWSKVAEDSTPEIELSNLSNGEKVHIRAVALNSQHESAPSPDYPLYVTSDPPLPPDGFRVELSEGAADLTWGEVLGVREYRLYVRRPGDSHFHLLYSGRRRSYQDKHPAIHSAAAAPRDSAPSQNAAFVEYCVASVNGNGEGPKSRIANTDPESWRNWDPKPGEP